MPDFNPKKALLILLGAEEWPGCPTLCADSYPPDNNPFRNSVAAMERYFRTTLGIEEGNLKSWFNSKQRASLILEEIGEFIAGRTSQTEVADVFFYYVGHGTFLRTDSKDYYLLVRSTEPNKMLSAIQINSLFDIMMQEAKGYRCYVILDACFSGVATKAIPRSHQGGVALFYSAEETQQSLVISKGKQQITLFTSAVLEVLSTGVKEYHHQLLSFGELKGLVRKYLAKPDDVTESSDFGSETLRPRCGFHASSDEIENVKIFPNPNYTPLSVSSDSLLVVGVDVGTTGIKAGLVEIHKGAKPPRVLYSKKVKHDEIGKEVGVLDRVENIIRDVLTGAKIDIERLDRIGIGLPGQVDCTKGLLKFAPGLKLRGVDARAVLQNRLGLEENKIFVDNDVNCSTLAELCYGYGRRQYKNFVCIFIGTGVGSGIVIGGRLIRGYNFAAGEVGHMKIDSGQHARKCNCGAKGCFEEYASARAIIRLAREKIHELRDRKEASLLVELNPDSVTPEDIARVVDSDDVYCKELAEQIANYLAVGIANVANILNPEAIILGGGIIEGFFKFGFFQAAVIEGSKKAMLDVCTTDILQTQLKNAPILGAASLNEDNTG